MSTITVHTPGPTTDDARRLFEEIKQVEEAVRREAYEMAQQRQPGHSSDFENWLAAEKKVVHVPACELLEDSKRYVLRAALPGWTAERIRVTALPGTLIVKADGWEAANDEGAVLFSEFNAAKVLRRFHMPHAFAVGKVQARLREGILEVHIPKLSSSASKDAVKAAPKKRAAAPKKKPSVKAQGLPAS